MKLIRTTLPAISSVLVVCAHPDDESFGLGAILSTLVDVGSCVSVLCFTHGEASTRKIDAGTLGDIRRVELAAASQVLGVSHIELLGYPDGALNAQSLDDLSDHITRVARDIGASVLLVFDHGGITGHPDHQHATRAALRAAPALALRVLAWVIPDKVAIVLNDEFATAFVGRDEADLEFTISVERTRQFEAIRCHRSQLTENPVLWRRLELLGDTEHLCYLI